MAVAGNSEEEVESRLRRHFEEIVGVYGRWFAPPPERPQFKGMMLIEYRMPGSAAFYMANEQIIRSPLVLPVESENLREGLKGHLGVENWKTWENLMTEVNAHLDAVVAFWKEIEEMLARAARAAGLFAQSRPTEAVVDTYWPELFVNYIWREPEYFEEKKAHSWESVPIVEEQVQITMQHGFDIVNTFAFAGTNLVRSQSRESVEKMKKAWEEEAMRAEPIKKGLMAERARIEGNAKGFQAGLLNLVADYARTSELPGVCPTCRPWLDELNPSPRSISQ